VFHVLTHILSSRLSPQREDSFSSVRIFGSLSAAVPSFCMHGVVKRRYENIISKVILMHPSELENPREISIEPRSHSHF
jgi:hypothetical protein